MPEIDAEKIMGEAIEKASDLIAEAPQVAEMILKQVLRVDPEDKDGLHLLGLCKHRLGKHVEAIEVIQVAMEVDPGNSDNHNNIALAYGCTDNYERSIHHLKIAIEMKPDHFIYKNNLALQYRCIEEHDKAIETLREAIDLKETPEMWTNLGGIYGEKKDYDKSIKCFKRALELNPDCSAAHVDLAYANHLIGNWEEAWEEYEWRKEYFPQMKFYKNEYDMEKLWDGKADLEGKRILVYGEQGIGDQLQFVRFFQGLKDRGAHTIYHCAPTINSIVLRHDAIDEVVNRDIVNKAGDEIPEYDYQIALLSLPKLLKEYEYSGKPYLEPATKKFTELVNKDYGDTFNVGIVWAGSPAHPQDQKRSIPLKHFSPLHETEGVKLFSLQFDTRKRTGGFGFEFRPKDEDKEIIDYAEGCENMSLVNLTPLIKGFDDTATILSGLDLLISCDTAAVHLAGAIGTPVWMMIPFNPDWRWQHDGETTCWYDSMRIFRQDKRGDWESVFEKVKEALDEVILQNK
jgi:tetratricopeptide (TPR) repeat protein